MFWRRRKSAFEATADEPLFAATRHDDADVQRASLDEFAELRKWHQLNAARP